MAVKTITITEEAYETLKHLRAPNESFSKAILRIGGRRSFREFAGVLSRKSADELAANVQRLRKGHRKTHERRIKRVIQGLGRGDT